MTLDICDTRSWEPKFLKSFVIFVNMQSLSLTHGDTGTVNHHQVVTRDARDPAGNILFFVCQNFVPSYTHPDQNGEDICLNFWLLNHRQFGKVFINKVRGERPLERVFRSQEESEPCDENKWPTMRFVAQDINSEKAPHIVIKLDDINFNFSV